MRPHSASHSDLCIFHAAVNLSAVMSGELALLRPRFGWLSFGNSGHYVLHVATPEETLYVWLIACKPLGLSSSPGSHASGSAAAAAGGNGDSASTASGSSGDEQMYVVQMLEKNSRGLQMAWE